MNILIEQIIKKARSGDEKAFEELLRIEREKLYRMAYLYVKNEDDALDIVQETACRAFTSIKRLKRPEYFSTWLTRILINSALDFIKKKKNVIPFDDISIFPEEEDTSLEDNMDLVEAINRLDDHYKTVVILRYQQDLPLKEISSILKCPEGTVKTRIRRALNQLKNELKRGVPDGQSI
ncbi:MAG: sigma-70 family RNA polymerase sigma factor [Bacillota bacterium]